MKAAYWAFNLYPDAGEGGGCFVRPLRPLSQGGPPNPGRSRQEAGRRARAKLRRYCAANRLNRFATLTYAPPGCFDPVRLRVDVAEFFRELRAGRKTAAVCVGAGVAPGSFPATRTNGGPP